MMNEINETELKVLKSAAQDAYFLAGSVERANRKFETAFLVMEKAKQYQAAGKNAYKKAMYWCFISALWWLVSTVMWFLR